MTTDEEILASYMKAHARKGIDKDGLTHHDDDGFPTTRARVYELMKLAREDSRKCKSCGVSLGDTCDKCEE